MLHQHRLDLPRFNPKSGNLDLVVNASQEFKIAVRHVADKIARLIELSGGLRPGRLERVGDKTLLGEFRPIPITARDAVAPDIELTFLADGDRLEVGIKHVELRVGNRPANGDWPLDSAALGHRIDAATHYRFGGSVFIHQHRVGRALLPKLEVSAR